MIVREVLKTTTQMGQTKCTSEHNALSSSVGTHNLTELRKNLEERMLLRTNEQARAARQEDQESWNNYRDTPSEGSDDEVPVASFGKHSMSHHDWTFLTN